MCSRVDCSFPRHLLFVSHFQNQRLFFLLQIEEKAKELESMRSEMKEMVGSLVPSHVATSLVETQTYTPETLEHSTVAAMRLSNFSELSSSVTPDTMVKLLSAINDVIDDVIVEQDVDKITSHPGTFMLISDYVTSTRENT